MAKDTEIQVAATAAEISTFFDRSRLEEMWGLANKFHQSGAFTTDCSSPAAALVKMQAGFEMGMPPMEAMNSLYIIKGHVTIFGMAMVKRIRKFGWNISYEDKPDSCKVTVTKGSETHTYTANVSEVKKTGAYSFAPKEKLRYHALSRLIRFEIPEVLDAGVTYLKEEAEDFEDAGIKVVDVSGIGMKVQNADDLVAEIMAATNLKDMQMIVSKIDKLSGPDQEKIKDAIIAKRKELVVDSGKAGEQESKLQGEQHNTVIVDDGIKANEATGEVIDQEAEVIMPEPAKAPREHKAVKVEHHTFDSITSTLANLKTNAEVVGYKDDMVRKFNDGEITETVYKHAITESQRRLNIITKNRREDAEQSSLIPN